MTLGLVLGSVAIPARSATDTRVCETDLATVSDKDPSKRIERSPEGFWHFVNLHQNALRNTFGLYHAHTTEDIIAALGRLDQVPPSRGYSVWVEGQREGYRPPAGWPRSEYAYTDGKRYYAVNASIRFRPITWENLDVYQSENGQYRFFTLSAEFNPNSLWEDQAEAYLNLYHLESTAQKRYVRFPVARNGMLQFLFEPESDAGPTLLVNRRRNWGNSGLVGNLWEIQGLDPYNLRNLTWDEARDVVIERNSLEPATPPTPRPPEPQSSSPWWQRLRLAQPSAQRALPPAPSSVPAEETISELGGWIHFRSTLGRAVSFQFSTKEHTTRSKADTLLSRRYSDSKFEVHFVDTEEDRSRWSVPEGLSLGEARAFWDIFRWLRANFEEKYGSFAIDENLIFKTTSFPYPFFIFYQIRDDGTFSPYFLARQDRMNVWGPLASLPKSIRDELAGKPLEFPHRPAIQILTEGNTFTWEDPYRRLSAERIIETSRALRAQVTEVRQRNSLEQLRQFVFAPPPRATSPALEIISFVDHHYERSRALIRLIQNRDYERWLRATNRLIGSLRGSHTNPDLGSVANLRQELREESALLRGEISYNDELLQLMDDWIRHLTDELPQRLNALKRSTPHALEPTDLAVQRQSAREAEVQTAADDIALNTAIARQMRDLISEYQIPTLKTFVLAVQRAGLSSEARAIIASHGVSGTTAEAQRSDLEVAMELLVLSERARARLNEAL